MSTSPISKRAQDIARQFRSMPRADRFDLAQERLNTQDAHVLTGVPRNVRSEWVVMAGLRCLRMIPINPRPDREVIFLHGGGFCMMSAMTHHRLAGHIANACNCIVVVPEYPLAPEHPYPVARNLCADLIKSRRADGPAEQIAMGDSAGGGLVLSAMCHLRDQRVQLPDALVLMSPWLDLSLSQATQGLDIINDPILSLKDLQAMATLYAGDTPFFDAGISPLLGNLEGLPPTLIQSSEHDLLRNDAATVAEKWPNNGHLEHRRYDGMLHSFQMFAGDVIEASQAIEHAAAFVDAI